MTYPMNLACLELKVNPDGVAGCGCGFPGQHLRIRAHLPKGYYRECLCEIFWCSLPLKR